MISIDRRAFFFLFFAWIVSSCVFLSGSGGAGGRVFPGFPIDDAFIHFSFARNLADHFCFGLNAAEWSSGSTSPLWVLLLAVSYKATGAMMASAWMWGALFVFLASLAAYQLVLLETRETRPALYAALFSLVWGRFLWGGFSGMEVPLFSFLMISALVVHRRAVEEGRVSFFSAFLFGLASLARPEGYLLFAIAVADLACRHRRELKKRAARILGYLGVYAAAVLPYMALAVAVSGRVFCSSYYSKMLFFWQLPPGTYLSAFVQYLYSDNPVLYFFVFAGVAWLLVKRRSLWGAWLLLFPIVAAFKVPLLIHHARYTMPFIPLYIAAGFIGWRLVERAQVRAVLLALMLGFAFFKLGAWANIFLGDALSVRHQHVAAARWVTENVPEGEAVAANDIGAISYLSGRRVVDLCGIVSVDILRILEIKKDVAVRHRLIRDYLISRGVRYLIIYPDWFAMVLEGSPFRRVQTIYYPFNTIGGSSKMEVYKIP